MPDTKPLARAPDRSLVHDPVRSPFWLTDRIQEGMSYFVSILPYTKYFRCACQADAQAMI